MNETSSKIYDLYGFKLVPYAEWIKYKKSDSQRFINYIKRSILDLR